MLKLGGYGFYRIAPLLLEFLYKNKEILVILFILGGLITGIICLGQIDHKSLIAYRRICHIGVIVMGAIGYLNLGAVGFLIVTLAHGFCSSGLFFLVNMTYERFNSRQLILIRGIAINSIIMLLG